MADQDHPCGGLNTIDLVVFGTYVLAVLALVVLTRGRLGQPVNQRRVPGPIASPAPMELLEGSR